MSERAFFEEHGWVIVRGAVSQARVAELRSALESAFERYAEHVQEVTEGVHQLPNVCKGDPTCQRFLFEDGEVSSLVRSLLGCEALQLQQDLAMMKPAGVSGGCIGWHQDHGYARYLQPPRAVGVRLALEPETLESGCMEVLDGSHTWGYLLDLEELNWFLEGTRPEILPESVSSRLESTRMPLELEPGDISVHHCLTVHASFSNRSEHARLTLIQHIFDAACTFDPEGLPHPDAAAYFPTDAAGHLSPLVFPKL